MNIWPPIIAPLDPKSVTMSCILVLKLCVICENLVPGADSVSAIFCKNCRRSVAYPIYVLFNWSLNFVLFPKPGKLVSLNKAYGKTMNIQLTFSSKN